MYVDKDEIEIIIRAFISFTIVMSIVTLPESQSWHEFEEVYSVIVTVTSELPARDSEFVQTLRRIGGDVNYLSLRQEDDPSVTFTDRGRIKDLKEKLEQFFRKNGREDGIPALSDVGYLQWSDWSEYLVVDLDPQVTEKKGREAEDLMFAIYKINPQAQKVREEGGSELLTTLQWKYKLW